MTASLRGQILVSHPHMNDINFMKTMILMIDHGKHGAAGLVINRPTSILVAHAFSSFFDSRQTCDELIFVGGPVERDMLLLLHNQGQLAAGSSQVLPELYVSNDRTVFEQILTLAAHGHTGLRYRIFFGYAGWAPMQLEAEMSQQYWYPIPARESLVFADDPYAAYDEGLHLVGLHLHRNTHVITSQSTISSTPNLN